LIIKSQSVGDSRKRPLLNNTRRPHFQFFSNLSGVRTRMGFAASIQSMTGTLIKIP